MQFINIFQIYILRVNIIHYILISANFQRAQAETRALYLWGSIISVIIQKFYLFFGSASRYNRVKKNQLDAQLFLSIVREPVHVSGVSSPIIRRYNLSNQDNRQSPKKNNKYQLLYTYGCTS